MARWVETRDYGRRLTNSETVACGACGALLASGQGRVWRCSGRDCALEGHPVDARGRWRPAYHCTCLDAAACRVRCTPPAQGVRELAESAREAWRRLKVEELRARVAAALAEKRALPVSTMRPPRYDEVFERGVEWLDSLAHDQEEASPGDAWAETTITWWTTTTGPLEAVEEEAHA